MISVKDLIDPNYGEKTQWFKYVDSFEIELRFLPRPVLSNIFDRSKKLEWENHVKIEKTDFDKLYSNLASKVIVGWRGLTKRILKKFAPIKEDDNENLDEEIPFTVENAVIIMKYGYPVGSLPSVDNFIQNIVTEITEFQEEKKEQEIKNSESSQNG